MNEIITNLNTPAWWFNIIFGSFIIWAVSRTLLFLKGQMNNLFRRSNLHFARYIKNNRHNIAAVNYQMMKSLCCFITFLLTCFIYLFLIVIGPLMQMKDSSTAAFFICMIPLVIIEFIYMNQRDRAMRLVTEYNKVRIKSIGRHS